MFPTPSPRIHPLTAIPPDLFPQLPLAAAKLYLILLSRLDPADPIPRCTATLSELAQLSGLSESACWKALRHLIDLELLRRLPRTYHSPTTYLLLFPSPTATTSSPRTNHTPTTSYARTSYSPTTSYAGTTYSPAPAAPTPISTPKTQTSSPGNTLLTQTAPPQPLLLDLDPNSPFLFTTDLEPDAIDAYFDSIYPTLTLDQKSILIYKIQHASAYLQTQPQEATP